MFHTIVQSALFRVRNSYTYDTNYKNVNKINTTKPIQLLAKNKQNNNKETQRITREYRNPLLTKTSKQHFSSDNVFVQQNIVIEKEPNKQEYNIHSKFYKKAGPTETLFYRPDHVKAAILTVGGISPGINNIIYDLVFSLQNIYNVDKIYGVINGFLGVTKYDMIELSVDNICYIQSQRGSYLGTSRNDFDPVTVLDYLKRRDINQLYIVGGDGAHKAAYKLHMVAQRRRQGISVACLPKTIDNDLPIIDKSFGFDTAVECAKDIITATHSEAKCTEKGIGIVKLMGRSYGWIAMYASLLSNKVDLCIIPERSYDFVKICKYINHRMNMKGHCMIVVAEGVNEHNLKNLQLNEADHIEDIGVQLKHNLAYEFPDSNIKYVDPTYIIRALPANCSDILYCKQLAQAAVHACMSGYSGFTVGNINMVTCLLPLFDVVHRKNSITDDNHLWMQLVQSNLQWDFE
jgi:6-phosphofructokinase 1